MPFYAVAHGRKTGVFKTWNECNAQVKGFGGARFKKFSCETQAKNFVRQRMRPSQFVGIKDVGPAPVIGRTEGSNPNVGSANKTNEKVVAFSGHCDSAVDVYTDGACRHNGFRSAKAGYGVFWGDDHPDNLSAPLHGSEQTNNRAEYKAVSQALTIAEKRGYRRVNVKTDSNLLVKSMTSWIPKWKENGWKTASGAPVKNQDLLRDIYDRCQRIDVHFHHVAGHAGIHGNEMADRLARDGADLNH